MEGLLTHQTPPPSEASRPQKDAPRPENGPPGPTPYAPTFGPPTASQSCNRPVQVNPADIQKGLEPTQSTALPQLANLNRKRAQTETPGQITAARVKDATGTPRSTRIKSLLPGGEDEQSMSAILEKLLAVTMAGIKFNDKGRMARRNQVDTESAADILVLVAAAHDLNKLDQTKRVLFRPGRQTAQHQIAAATRSAQAAPPSSFDFQLAELNTKLDALAEQVAALTTAIKKPTNGQAKTTSYALAASKHAPGIIDLTAKKQQKMAPAKKPASPRPTTTVTLSQTDRSQPVLTEQSMPRLLIALNSHLAEKQVKIHDTSKSVVEVKSIQRHTFNNLILHLESPSHADAIRKQASKWLPSFSDKLVMKDETHAILVHGIPTTFNPKNPEHLEDLIASNSDRLSSFSAIHWMNVKAVKEEQK